MKKCHAAVLLVLLFVSATLFAKPAKYVFLMIGDGMGPEFTRFYMSQYPESNFSKFTTRIATGTNNVHGLKTDSAASGTALACGIKTYNGAVGVDKDGKPVSSLARLLKTRNWKIGIISSVGINDATPAAHFANRISRKDQVGTLSDLYASGYDFFGVSLIATPREHRGRRFDRAVMRSGYTLVKNGKLSALKPENKNMFISETRAKVKADGSPRLADVTAKAAELLSADGSSFFIMVEGGAIDHNNHRNDSAFAVREMIEFDAAIGEALKFAEKHPEETLIVVTADHDTGGFQINDLSRCDRNFYRKQTGKLDDLTDMMIRMKKSRASAAEMKRGIVEAVGISGLSPEETAQLDAAYNLFAAGKRTRTDKFTADMGYGKYNPLVFQALRIRDKRNGFNYTTSSHTTAKVTTFVKGAGAENFTAPQENSDIPHRIAAAAGFPGLLKNEGSDPPFPVRKKIVDNVDLLTVTTNSATVRYGFNTGARRKFKLSSGVEKSVDGFFGRITFDNLKPDTEYTLTTPLDQPITFRTQKEVPGKMLLKIGVISDPHLSMTPDTTARMYSRSLQLVSGMVDKFNADKMDFILVAGDVTEKGHPSEIEVAVQAFKNAKMKVFFTRGNHDNITDKAPDAWIKAFGSPAGITVSRGVQIARLNIPKGKLDTPENRAVIDKIDEKLPLIIFTHYQLFPDDILAVRYPDSIIVEMRGKKSFADAPAGARKLLEKLSRCNALLLVGHNNCAAIAKAGKLTQINMPATTEYPAGAVALEVYDNGVRVTFVPIADAYAEEYSRRRGAEMLHRQKRRARYIYPVWNSFVVF